MASDNDSTLRVVDLSWSPERIKDFCENNSDWILQLGPEITATDLERLYRRHLAVTTPYLGVIAEIAGDERTPDWILNDIASRFWVDVEVMAYLATNKSASNELLRRLLDHEHSSVREHAEALLTTQK
jgi:hypothetical protein